MRQKPMVNNEVKPKVEKFVQVKQPDGTFKTEKITVEEAVTFWEKYKNVLWPIIVGVVALFGGNVDRIYSALPDVYNVAGLRKTVENHEVRLTKVETTLGTPVNTDPIPQPPPPEEPEVKVSRPTK